MKLYDMAFGLWYWFWIHVALWLLESTPPTCGAGLPVSMQRSCHVPDVHSLHVLDVHSLHDDPDVERSQRLAVSTAYILISVDMSSA